MRQPVALIAGIALAAVLGIGAHSMAATNQGPSTANSKSPREQDNSKPDARDSDGPDGRSEHASKMVAIARAHRVGMKQWQRCTAAARASNGGSSASHDKCSKPLPPGWVKHPNKHAGAHSPGHGKSDEAHGD